jgi:hypothetical protein
MLRQGANEPQTQMVRDMRDALNAGTKQPIEYATTPSVDIKNSLEPFVMVFDSEGETIASSGQLNDGALRVPEGVLDYVANKSSDGVTGGAEHTVTLQPEPGVRLAAVFKVVPLNLPGAQYYIVMAARSLHDVENYERMVLMMAGALWSVGMIVIALCIFWHGRNKKSALPVT